MTERSEHYWCSLCQDNIVDVEGEVCEQCQYEVLMESIVTTAFIYRDNPDNEALKEELFDALADYENWYEQGMRND